MSWLGNGATASLHSNDVIVYSGGESLWILSLPTLTWNEVWTNGQTPPHGLRFHTSTSLRLTPQTSNNTKDDQQLRQQSIDRSKSTDSTTSTANSIGVIVVLGGEPRASADLPEATQYGTKLNMHVLKIRERVWTVANCTGDVPENRCMHTTTKLRGTTLAVYGGRPLGVAHPTNEEANPIFEDTNELRAKLASEGFYDVFLIDANAGVWRRITPHRGEDAILQPCLWGHTAFATSVFPPRRSQNGEYRHRIDLVIHGGFDISPTKSHQDEMSQRARAGLVHNAFVLQPLSENQPTVLKWGLAPLMFDKRSGGIPSDGAFTLHSAASPDSAREGAQPAFLLGGFSVKTEEDGEIGLAPTGACGRVTVRGTWQEGPRGQISSLPALQTLIMKKNFSTTSRPLLLFYSDQLLVLESTERFWLLDLQEQSVEEQEWAPVDTTLGSNEDVERWRIGCPMHPEFVSGDEEDNDVAQQQQIEQADPNISNSERENELLEKEKRRLQIEAEEKEQNKKKQLEKEEKKKAKEDKKKAKEEAKKLAKPGKPPKPQTGEVRGEWKALHDEKTGRQYYVNINTRKSTWKIQETSFNEPLPTETHFSDDDDDDEDEDDDSDNGGRETNAKKNRANRNNNNNNNSNSSWRDATGGEPVRGYETSMMNPIYDTVVNQNDVRAVDQSQQRYAHGTPDSARMSRFLSGSSQPGINNNNNNEQGGGVSYDEYGNPIAFTQQHQNWWSTAADARHRNEREQSSQRQQGLNQSQARSDYSEFGVGGGGKPPTAPPPNQQQSRTPISQVGPPSLAPTPSIWNEPHMELPIDFLLKGIENGNATTSNASTKYQHARRGSYHQNYVTNQQQQQSSSSRRKEDDDNLDLTDFSHRRARRNSELASLLLAPDLRKQKEDEEKRNKHEQIAKQRELYRQQQEERGVAAASSLVENGDSERNDDDAANDGGAHPWMDPAEILDYPFDLETALLLPRETVLRARAIFINNNKEESKIPKDRDLDVKKYLQSYTQYETMSEDQEREEKKRRHMEKSQSRRRQQQQQHQDAIFPSSSSTSTNNTSYRPRSVFDMLPTMLSSGKFGDFIQNDLKEVVLVGASNVSPQPRSQDQNINNNNDDILFSKYGRPTPFVAAEYSRTGSAADWTESSRASTPVAAAHLDAVVDADDQESTTINGMSKSRSMTSHNHHNSQRENAIPGLSSHHVSQSIKDMLFADSEW